MSTGLRQLLEATASSELKLSVNYLNTTSETLSSDGHGETATCPLCSREYEGYSELRKKMPSDIETQRASRKEHQAPATRCCLLSFKLLISLI